MGSTQSPRGTCYRGRCSHHSGPRKEGLGTRAKCSAALAFTSMSRGGAIMLCAVATAVALGVLVILGGFRQDASHNDQVLIRAMSNTELRRMRSLEEMIGQRAGGAKWHNRFRVVSFQGAPKLREPRILRGANPQRTSASLRQQRTAQLEEEEEEEDDEEDGPTPAPTTNPTTNPTFSPTTESPMLPCLR